MGSRVSSEVHSSRACLDAWVKSPVGPLPSARKPRATHANSGASLFPPVQRGHQHIFHGVIVGINRQISSVSHLGKLRYKVKYWVMVTKPVSVRARTQNQAIGLEAQWSD